VSKTFQVNWEDRISFEVESLYFPGVIHEAGRDLQSIRAMYSHKTRKNCQFLIVVCHTGDIAFSEHGVGDAANEEGTQTITDPFNENHHQRVIAGAGYEGQPHVTDRRAIADAGYDGQPRFTVPVNDANDIHRRRVIGNGHLHFAVPFNDGHHWRVIAESGYGQRQDEGD